MVKYLLDTDIIVDHLRGKRIIDERVIEDGASISIITLGELLFGAYKSDNFEKSLRDLREKLTILGLMMENLNEITMIEFAKIKVELEKRGSRIEDFDLLIAATAKVLDLTLVTRNLKHFQRIKGLKLSD